MYKEPVYSNLYYFVFIFCCVMGPFCQGCSSCWWPVSKIVSADTVSMQMQHNICACVCTEGDARHMLWFLQTVGKNHSVFLPFLPPPFTLPLSLFFLPGPPVVVMGRDLSAHLMQLMFACAWGHEHRDTHSPDTHSALLSPSVTTLSHSLSSASLPLLSLALLPLSSLHPSFSSSFFTHTALHPVS